MTSNIILNWFGSKSPAKKEYQLECPRCKQSVRFFQDGDQLYDEILDSILEIIHRNDTYDAFQGYVDGIFLNLDVIENGKCCNI